MTVNYLVTLDLRYAKAPLIRGAVPDHDTILTTIGVYDNFDAACAAGNDVLTNLEARYPLHVYPDGRKASRSANRFSRTGGPFGSRVTLVSNLAYLKTPFRFFVKITRLNYHDVDGVIDYADSDARAYRAWKNRDDGVD
jgi:hypothetical protein